MESFGTTTTLPGPTVGAFTVLGGRFVLRVTPTELVLLDGDFDVKQTSSLKTKSAVRAVVAASTIAVFGGDDTVELFALNEQTLQMESVDLPVDYEVSLRPCTEVRNVPG